MKDSTNETQAHIERVQELIGDTTKNLAIRAEDHDQSKLEEPEKSAFDTATERLKGCTYGSPEYKGFLAALKPALDHHYANNTHHPEHYPNGVRGMSLLDLLEMLCDWKAAGERHADGCIERSLVLNRARFAIGDELQEILINTAIELGWLDEAVRPHAKECECPRCEAWDTLMKPRNPN